MPQGPLVIGAAFERVLAAAARGDERAFDVLWRELQPGLPPDQAEVIALRVVAGLEVAEVARIVGKRPGAVRVLAHRGLRAWPSGSGTAGPRAPAQPPEM